MEEAPVKIRVEHIYKVFGDHPEKAVEMYKQGMGKDEIFKQTGMTIGVSDASFDIRAGETFVIMGLSGSGKSTMVRLLNRLIEPSAGEIYINDRDIVKMSNSELIDMRREIMSMVFQSFALMPHMTVGENTAFGLEICGVGKKERLASAHAALERVGLGQHMDSYPSELSGGMQQRVGLARALAVNPEILLMDEAFSALDPLIRTEMQDELLRLQAEDQRTIVFISHDLDEAMRLGDRIAIMHDGRVVQVGTPEEILQNPADDYVQAFFRGVDPTGIISAGDIARKTQVTVIKHPGNGPRSALQQLISHDRDYGYVLDRRGRFLGVVSHDNLKNNLDSTKDLRQLVELDAQPVLASMTMQEVLPQVTGNAWPVPVVDDNGVYLGVISRNVFLRTLQTTHEEEHCGAAIAQIQAED
ncbi:MAG: glycine betaine/L-proline ABC transporter ATP-binding protein ProV [Desulfuromonadaceae bacterium]|nr:glycine betaine/L-proline ABC transporter ATP-binding protein ProV [Desulfuromonadaceae bacterium]